MSRRKAKAELVPAARDQAEATAWVARIGELDRKRAKIEADLADLIAKATAEANGTASQLNAEAKDLSRGVQLWAEANRATLTREGKTKTVKLPTGDLAWRVPPPKVTIKGQELVLAATAEKKFAKFRRVKVEIDKEAMLADPDLARQIAGVTIGSGPEEFIITPSPPPALGGAA